MKKITVITGAAGMIGSCLVRYLNDQGLIDLLLVDDLKCEEKWKNLVGKKFSYIVSKRDLFSWLEEHKEEVDAIVHLGACSDTVEKDADYLLENNYRYTIRLAKWALERGVRFVYASSAATYGSGKEGFLDDEKALDSLRPLNMYGYSKHLIDLWMQKEGVFNQVVALKYFNVFGPNEYHKGRMASMLFKMMQKNGDGSTVHLFKSKHPDYSDGNQMRDFIYAKDVAKMTAAFLEPSYKRVGGIYNIGLGKATTWNELVEAFFIAIEKPTKIGYIDIPDDLEKQYQYFTCASMEKFLNLFPKDSKYRQMTPICDAVKDYVQNYLQEDLRW